MNTPITKRKMRYPGLSPFTDQDSDIFFGREKDLRNLMLEIDGNIFTILFSEPGVGKTSLVNAGLIPILKRNRNFEIILFQFPKYDSRSEKVLSEYFYEALEIHCHKESYIDKLTNIKSFWNLFKKIKSERINPAILLIFDSVENIFEYPETEQKDFFENLSKSVNQIIPDEVKKDIGLKLVENPDFLTEDGRNHLETKPDVRILFSANIRGVENFKPYFPLFPGIERPSYELLFFSPEQVAASLVLPAKYNLKPYICLFGWIKVNKT